MQKKRIKPEEFMERLGLKESTISQFLSGKVMCSINGAVTELSPAMERKLLMLRKKYKNSTFYHVVVSELGDCEIISFLICPKIATESMMYKDFLDDGCVPAYGWNLEYPEWSEIGDVGIVHNSAGALMRVW